MWMHNLLEKAVTKLNKKVLEARFIDAFCTITFRPKRG